MARAHFIALGLAALASHACAEGSADSAEMPSACAAKVPHKTATLAEVEALEAVETTSVEVRLLQARMRLKHTELEADVRETEMPSAASEVVVEGSDASGSEEAVAESSNTSGSVSYDHNGHVCLLCGSPLPERLGGRNYTERRSDCGSLSSRTGPSVEILEKPAVEFMNLKSSSGAATNGFCELNFAKGCVDAIANEDYLYWAKSVDMLHSDLHEGALWDARYCQVNGFLAADVVSLQHNFTGLRAKAKHLCETKYSKRGIENLTFKDMVSRSRYEDHEGPRLDDAETLAAWNCAMGDLGCDMAMCSYSFCEKENGQLGIYGECPGWHPVKGMPF